MKKLLILVLIIFYSTVSGQLLETIGSGVVDFLLSSPSTANKMNTDQQIALSIIGGLLDKAGQMKHQTNVATAGQTQINLNTDSGQQIQLAMDTNGNVYALSNGIIYPIGSNVVSQAKEYVINQQSGYMDYISSNSSSNRRLMLPDYNYIDIKNKWNSIPSSEIIEVASKKAMYYSDILEKFDIGQYNGLYFNGKNNEFVDLEYCTECTKYLNNKKRFRVVSGFLWIKPQGYTFKRMLRLLRMHDCEKGTFTARWYNDMNGNNIAEFDEFQDIRRNFYQDESFIIVCGLFSEYRYYAKLKIFEQTSDKLIDTKIITINEDIGYVVGSARFAIPKGFIKPGIYLYYISLNRIDTNKELATFTDKFQILSK